MPTFNETFLDRIESVVKRSGCTVAITHRPRERGSVIAHRRGGETIAELRFDLGSRWKTVTLHAPRLGVEEKSWEFTSDDNEAVELLLAEWRDVLAKGR